MVLGLNHGMGMRYTLLHSPTSILFIGYHVSVLGLEQPGCGVDELHQSSAEVKNEWNYISAPHLHSWCKQ
jgi:hypothetical protein